MVHSQFPRLVIVKSWVKDWVYFGKPWRVPSKAEGRTCTKKWYKANRARKDGWRYVTVEPKHVMQTADSIICTAVQAAAIRKIQEQQNLNRINQSNFLYD